MPSADPKRRPHRRSVGRRGPSRSARPRAASATIDRLSRIVDAVCTELLDPQRGVRTQNLLRMLRLKMEGGAPGETELHGHAPAPRQFTPPPTAIEDQSGRFQRLVGEWKANTSHLSSVAEMAMHPAYQQIIGLGPDAIPLLLAELQREPDHWFWALRAVTGADPVPVESRGQLDAMRRAWLQWGRDRGYCS